LIVTDIANNALCYGQNGTATVTVISGGTPTFDIIWDDFTGDFTNNNIPPDTNFGYTVTDNNLCSASGSVFITQPAEIEITLNATNVSCYGGSDGNAEVSNVTGGTGTISFEWNNLIASPINPSITANNYSVVGTDINGCSGSESISVYEPSELILTLYATPANCGIFGGTVTASASGGTPNYSFSWSEPGTDITISDLDPGTYTCYLTDNNDCFTSQDIEVGISGNIQAVISVVQPISCYGDSNGIIEGSSPNGENPIFFDWEPQSSSQTVSNLAAGTYILTVTDSWGCTGSTNFNLTEPEAININPIITNVSCYGESNGSIQVSASNGTPPYSYIWNGSNETNPLDSITAGDYELIVTDYNLCSLSKSYTISQPDELTLDIISHNVTCYGLIDGAILSAANGGTTPYTYTIFNGIQYSEGESHGNLPAGLYTTNVVDNNGCIATSEVSIVAPSELSASLMAYDPSCIGNNDGYIEINAVGGTAPYLFGWNENYLDFPLLSGLSDGNYEVSVRDSNNCVINLGNIILSDNPVDCIKIPNAFTPNGDGINDTWIIENIELFPGARVFVYNRWGQELWVGYPGDEWDGIYNDKIVPAGVYLYIINLYNGTNAYTGTVSIVH